MRRKNSIKEEQMDAFLRRNYTVGGGMIGHPAVASEKSRRCATLPRIKGKKGNIANLRTNQLPFIFLTKPFPSKFPSVFFQEGALCHGSYLTSSEEDLAPKAIFRHSKRITLPAIIIPHRPKRIYLSGCYVLTLRTLTFH